MAENGKLDRWHQLWIADATLKKCQQGTQLEALDMNKLISAFTLISVAFGLSFIILIIEIAIKNGCRTNQCEYSL